MDEGQIPDITRVIQLALAPAFLLSALGALLNVFTNRLARIVDRARALHVETREAGPSGVDASRAAEIRSLELRARMVRWALTLGTVAALLISLVIGCSFLGFMLRVNVARPVAALFIAAMVSLTLALGCFLREVTVAIGGVEARARRDVQAAEAPVARGPTEGKDATSGDPAARR